MDLSPILCLPIELLLSILDQSPLTRSDYNNLRLVHSKFQQITCNYLFKTIKFHYVDLLPSLMAGVSPALNTLLHDQHEYTRYMRRKIQIMQITGDVHDQIQQEALILPKHFGKSILESFTSLRTIALYFDFRYFDNEHAVDALQALEVLHSYSKIEVDVTLMLHECNDAVIQSISHARSVTLKGELDISYSNEGFLNNLRILIMQSPDLDRLAITLERDYDTPFPMNSLFPMNNLLRLFSEYPDRIINIRKLEMGHYFFASGSYTDEIADLRGLIHLKEISVCIGSGWSHNWRNLLRCGVKLQAITTTGLSDGLFEYLSDFGVQESLHILILDNLCIGHHRTTETEPWRIFMQLKSLRRFVLSASTATTHEMHEIMDYHEDVTRFYRHYFSFFNVACHQSLPLLTDLTVYCVLFWKDTNKTNRRRMITFDDIMAIFCGKPKLSELTIDITIHASDWRDLCEGIHHNGIIDEIYSIVTNGKVDANLAQPGTILRINVRCATRDCYQTARRFMLNRDYTWRKCATQPNLAIEYPWNDDCCYFNKKWPSKVFVRK